MDTRINIAVIVGVVFVLAFAVTLTQYENQAESQDAESEISDEIITHWTEEFDYTENIISVTGTASASSEPDTLIVVLGVESEAKTANESLSKNSKCPDQPVVTIGVPATAESSKGNPYPSPLVAET